MAQSKQYKDNSQKYDRDRLHSDEEAIAIIKSLGTKKFDETIDIVVRLGVDPRKAEQMIRATVALPSGTGKDVRIAVFAQGEAAQAARDAGAEHVGGEELAAEVAKGMTDFDLAIATPDMMPVVGKLGRVLGPRGLMPNPKTGTVTTDVAKAVGEFKGGMVEYRTDRFANVHVPIGKASFDHAALLLNLRALIAELEKAKPASSKGLYMQKIVLSTTMGPGVRVDPSQVVTSTT
jgi:large subunit ribosomal protein L1